MEKISCPICGGDGFDLLFKAQDNICHIDGEFDIVKCEKCSLIITNPRPDKEEINRYYPKEYQCYNLNHSRTELVVKLRRFLGRFTDLFYSETIILPLEETTPIILEIGCGGGNFLYEYSRLNPQHKIIGSDFNLEVIKALKKQNLDVFQSDLTSIALETGHVDCVYGWMVLEHVHDINKALGEIGRVLKKQGKFIFSIPNAASWEFKLFRGDCYSNHVPNHLYHFTPKTIKQLLKKNGFRIERILYQKTLRDAVESFRLVCARK
jgi:ubiquinone/menaquinone biosynthesis C-methylase UbiE